jgi:hypothetical protein
VVGYLASYTATCGKMAGIKLECEPDMLIIQPENLLWSPTRIYFSWPAGRHRQHSVGRMSSRGPLIGRATTSRNQSMLDCLRKVLRTGRTERRVSKLRMGDLMHATTMPSSVNISVIISDCRYVAPANYLSTGCLPNLQG